MSFQELGLGWHHEVGAVGILSFFFFKMVALKEMYILGVGSSLKREVGWS